MLNIGVSGCWILVVMKSFSYVRYIKKYVWDRDWRALGRIEGSAPCSVYDSILLLSKETMERAVDVSKQ